MRPGLVLLAGLVLGGCAASNAARPARSSLTATEAALLGKVIEKDDGGFRRVWKSPELGGWSLVKWNGDRSSAAIDAPRGLLQIVRDEVGRLNQNPGSGPDLYLTVTVHRFRPDGLFRRAAALCELAARDGRGRLMWIAEGPVEANPELANSLADGDAVLVARELLRKVRRDLRPAEPRPAGPTAVRK